MSEKVDSAGSLLNAMGGTRGLLDSGLPALVFVTTFSITKDLRTSAYAAVGLALLLGIYRLVKRDTLQHTLSGILGVVICAVFARSTGKAENFYLPGLFINGAYALAYAVSNLVKWPIFGLIIGAINGEGTAWRKDPATLAKYIRIGWLWVAMFSLRLVVQYPLYVSENVTALGIARVIMGWPLFLLTGYLTWVMLKSKKEELAV